MRGGGVAGAAAVRVDEGGALARDKRTCACGFSWLKLDARCNAHSEKRAREVVLSALDTPTSS